MNNSYKAETTNNTINEYFDLHTSGVGYVNRIREVNPKKGDAFMACTIGALRGLKTAVEYSYFDCRVSGAEASKLIRRLEKASKDNKQILIGFKIGDQYTETFVYKKGPKKGEVGICTKAHLLYISWVKINGDSVYTAPIKESVNKIPNESVSTHNESEAVT